MSYRSGVVVEVHSPVSPGALGGSDEEIHPAEACGASNSTESVSVAGLLIGSLF
jgi:hypothetical protein